jgi:hypothetical protein
MSFADIINQEQKKLEESNRSEGVKYPETKHKRLYFTKDQKDLFIQVLPSASLYSAFSVPARKIFLSAKSSQGKDINSNFTLDAEQNEGSLLEQKVKEWGEKGLIPNGFGGQTTPKKVFIVNAVRIVQNPANPQQYVQERDEHGNLVVRVFEMPQSGYSNLIRKLADPLYNTSGSELSFMDINKPALIKISKPAKGQMEYPVEVYTNVILPPLGQGWENQLEDLNAQAVPTERLENGYDWVQAFVDMKEGRKPGSSSKREEAAPQPQVNPYAQQPQTQPQPQQPNIQPQSQPQPTPGPGPGLMEDPLNIDVDSSLNNLPPAPQPQTQPQTPTAPDLSVPNPGPAPTAPTHNVDVNSNGLMNIDAMLAKELGN